MNRRRLLELWTPPAGYRLASLIATTYQLQPDFLEEDLLPVALGLRLPAARGRDFRIELEQALQDAEVTIYLHPDGYQAGLRRSPRIDLVPLPSTRVPKLHAKVALARYVPEAGGGAADQMIRLVIGSANLTAWGYRDNIEVAIALDDRPGGSVEEAIVVRDAAAWMEQAIPTDSAQAQQQHLAHRAVFAARPMGPVREAMRFVSLPSEGGLLRDTATWMNGDLATRITVVSPFWPTGTDPGDVIAALFRAGGGTPEELRVLGPAILGDGTLYPEVPPELIAAAQALGVRVSVAAADPSFGCRSISSDDEDEYGSMDRTKPAAAASRALHAKMLIFEGSRQTVLAAGSFNMTRKGLGLHGQGNTEAGLLWRITGVQRAQVEALIGFADRWRMVEGAPAEQVRAPPPREGEGDGTWPAYLHSVSATRTHVRVEGDGTCWPAKVTLRMQDLRARLVQKEFDFDAWVVVRPENAEAFSVDLELKAQWLDSETSNVPSRYPPLADLELKLEWDDKTAVVPVLFLDKHEFPVIERSTRESERDLIDWFLGLRPAGEPDPDGFGHAIDPLEHAPPQRASMTADILSYLIRDFVHALPGIRARLRDGSMTETGLGAALLGPRSPLALAREVHSAANAPGTGPNKTVVATAFQLAELLFLVRDAQLPELAGGATERLRAQCLAAIGKLLDDLVPNFRQGRKDPILSEYLQLTQKNSHATRA